jgi:hypothetical protein
MKSTFSAVSLTKTIELLYATLCILPCLALGEATKLAQTLSSFPQECLRRDRLSAYNSCFNSSSLADAFKFEWDNAKHVITAESVRGRLLITIIST